MDPAICEPSKDKTGVAPAVVLARRSAVEFWVISLLDDLETGCGREKAVHLHADVLPRNRAVAKPYVEGTLHPNPVDDGSAANLNLRVVDHHRRAVGKTRRTVHVNAGPALAQEAVVDVDGYPVGAR